MDQSEERDFDSLEEFDDSDSGSDFETQLKSHKRKPLTSAPGTPRPKRQGLRAAAQYQATDLRVSPNVMCPARSPVRVSHEATPRQGRGRTQTTAGHLYEAVKSGKSATVAVVDEWLDSYKQDREAGLLELINFIVQCCGCKGVVSKEMFDGMQNAEIISVLTKEFNEDSEKYPLSCPGTQWRRFVVGLCEFMRTLVRQCQNSLLYDEYLFSSLLALLTGLSDSQVRAFRHTSTLIAMKLMTGMVEVAVVVFTQTETTRRRCEAERTKEVERRAHERLEELQAAYRELLEQQEELRSLMNTVFRGVFVHRYRDRVPEIRAVCIEEIGVWLRLYPCAFLNDGYLKYLGWTLHDKQGTVRVRCLHALQGLYQEDFIGHMELFTSRFKERMLCMVLDKDRDVAVEVTRLLLLIQQKTEEGLSEEDCARVYPLVYASHRGLACAAGAFLYHKLCRESQDEEMGKSSVTFIHLLISFYIQGEVHEHGAYLVDSLWASAGAELRDWESMTSLLLQEKGQGQSLKDEEEGALIELMICAVRQAAESRPPVGRGKRIVGVKDRKAQAQYRKRLTSHFILVLPQLLAKYSADREKVSRLLKAPLYFDLETYGSRLEKYLELLLSQLCGIVEKHTDDGVLEACARVACALCSEDHTFSARASLAFGQLLDAQVDRFTSHINDLLQGTADDDEVYSAATALKRIAAFSSAGDLTGRQLFDPCIQILKCGMETTDIDKELKVPALKCASFHVLWEKVRLNNSTPTKEELKRMKQEVRSLCAVCQSCLSAGHADIRDQAFLLLCDLLMVFCAGPARGQMLAYPLDGGLRAEMASFLIDYIFVDPKDDPSSEEEEEEEEVVKIAALQRRRNQLAGYCKLVIYGVLELSSASDIFKFYSKFFRDFGDIIKETLSKSKIISQMQSAKTVCLSLKQLFTEYCIDGEAEVSPQEFGEIRELARRLAMSFGIDLQRVRKPLVSLHEDGISFAFEHAGEGDKPPTNLMFLEVLSEFSFKLLKPDRTYLLGFLKRVCSTPSPAWPSLSLYQRSVQGVGRQREGEEPRDAPTRKRRRTMSEGSYFSLTEGGSLGGSILPSNLPTPSLTSTMLRQPSGKLPASQQFLDTGGDSDPQSEDDFIESPLIHWRGHQPSAPESPSPASPHSDLDSHLNLLSLIEEHEEEEEEEEEAEIEDFLSEGSDQETHVTLPVTQKSSSYLEGLFD